MKSYKKTMMLVLVLGCYKNAEAGVWWAEIGKLLVSGLGNSYIDSYIDKTKDLLYKEMDFVDKCDKTQDKTDAVVRGLNKMATKLFQLSRQNSNATTGRKEFLPEEYIGPLYKKELKSKLEELYQPEITTLLTKVNIKLMDKIVSHQKNITRINSFQYEETL